MTWIFQLGDPACEDFKPDEFKIDTISKYILQALPHENRMAAMTEIQKSHYLMNYKTEDPIRFLAAGHDNGMAVTCQLQSRFKSFQRYTFIKGTISLDAGKIKVEHDIVKIDLNVLPSTLLDAIKPGTKLSEIIKIGFFGERTIENIDKDYKQYWIRLKDQDIETWAEAKMGSGWHEETKSRGTYDMGL